MPSSGYIANSFVAGEQPSTAVWNELWGNDASFNSGTGFNDSILISRHFSTNSVPAAALATNAITLGIATQTSSQSTPNTAATAIPGLSVGVTIPAGGRDVYLMFEASGCYTSTAATQMNFYLYSGASSGALTTLLQSATWYPSGSTVQLPCRLGVPITAPAAGAIYYTAAYATGNTSDAVNMQVAAGATAYIMATLV